MRQKLLTFVTLLLISSMTLTPVFADEVIFNGAVRFLLGSLIAEGELAGLGHRDVTVILEAKGIPDVTCSDHAGHTAAAHNPRPVTARGTQKLQSSQYEHGISAFHVETRDIHNVSAKRMGCPDGYENVHVNFVFWTDAQITVKDTADRQTLLHAQFKCHTTRHSVSCTETH